MMTATKPQTAVSARPPHLRTGTQRRARRDNSPEPSDILRLIAPEPCAGDFPELNAALGCRLAVVPKDWWERFAEPSALPR
jgi:hypothetical protein